MSTYSDREIEEALKSTEYCSLCDQTTFMCDCERHNVTDFDSYDDDYE